MSHRFCRSTARPAIGRVKRRANAGMTSAAQLGRWHREAVVAVTVTARDAVLGDVGLVPRAIADVAPCKRHVLWWCRWGMMITTAGAARNDHGQDDPLHLDPLGPLGFDPTG